jgi:serine protease AprX
MARTQIVAQFMHDDEREVATSRMDSPTVEGKLVVGEIEEAEIPTLEEAGLLVQRVDHAEAPLSGSIPGVAPRAVLRGAGPRATAADLGFDAPPTPAAVDVYVVELAGPLLRSWREGLQSAGCELLEYLQHHRYTARLALADVPGISQLPFVRTIRLYSVGDTIDPSHLTMRGGPAAGPPQMVTFELLVHRPQDLEQVRAWLEERHVDVAIATGRKIRFFAIRSSPVLPQVARLPEVAAVDEYIPPKLSNDRARQLLGIDPENLGNGGGGGLGSALVPQTGKGQIVAIADTGLDDQHPDFQGRIVGLIARGRPGDTSDPIGHGTHVAGSVLGDGSASGGSIRGTAPEAELFFQSVLDAQGGLGGLDPELAQVFEEAYQAGARIHSNSWGATAESAYRVNSREVDDYVASHPDMLIVIAAGNDGSAANPQNSAVGYVDLKSLDAPATGKNALTVGASRSDRILNPSPRWQEWWPVDFPDKPIGDEEITGDPESMAAFSGRGPCDEEIRIKPDVVGPGTFILSTRSQLAAINEFWPPLPPNNRYGYMGGTSMATPLVAGCAALVRQYYVDEVKHDPSAALLKASLVNGSKWMNGADATANYGKEPNFHQGFGRVYLPWTIPNPANPDLQIQFSDDWETDDTAVSYPGDAYQFVFNASGQSWLRLCLVWTDPPGRGVQNNLTVTLEHGPTKTRWSGNENRMTQFRGPDLGNNVQVIRIDSPPAGAYVAQVTANNILGAPQRFALVMAGGLTGPITTMHAT